MEAIGMGLEAIGKGVAACASAVGWIYVVGFLCKTFLIYMDKATPESLKDWFKLRNNSGRL